MTEQADGCEWWVCRCKRTFEQSRYLYLSLLTVLLDRLLSTREASSETVR